MNRADYWVLDLVKQAQYPLAIYTFDPAEMFDYTNVPLYEMTRDGLTAALFQLFDQKFISAYDEERDSFELSQAELSAILTGIKANSAEFSRQSAIHYGLTPAGGALWEQYSNPDWSKFRTNGYHFTDTEVVNREIIAGNPAIIQEFHSHLVNNQGQFNGSAVDLATIKIDQVSPWQATYWKQLETGYRITYKAKEAHGDYAKPDEADYLMRVAWCLNYLTGQPAG